MTRTNRSTSGLLGALPFLLLAGCSLELAAKDRCIQETDCTGGNACSFGQCVAKPALETGMATPAAGLPIEQCGTAGSVQRYGTEAELRALLSGQWLFCSGSGVGPSDQVGLELTEDHAYVLSRSANGNLVRGQGARYDGTIELRTSGGHLQVAIGWSSGDTTLLEPAFEGNPRRMMVNEGGHISIYSGATASPATPSAQCSAGTGVVRPFSTESQARALLVGQWLFCSGSALGPVGQLGLEFTSDSRVHVIHADARGNTVSGGGFLFEASLELADLTPAAGPPRFQLTLHWANGSSVTYTLTFEDAPRRLVLADASGARVTYAGLGAWGGDVSGPGGGAGGMTGGTTTCDLLSGSGCAGGQKCTVQVQSTPNTVLRACSPAGSSPRGALCHGDNDCEAGTLCGCLGVGNTSCTCRRFCDPASPATACGADATCEIGIPAIQDVRLCTDACVLFSSTCQDHQECKTGAQGLHLCSPIGTTGAGGPCRGGALSSQCAEGLACNATTLTCLPMCDAAHPCGAGACGSDGICQGS